MSDIRYEVDVDSITFRVKLPSDKTLMFVETLNRLAKIAGVHNSDCEVKIEDYGSFAIKDRRSR